MEGTKHYNAALLHQIDELLAQLNDEELSTARGLLFGGTIGQHVRHILEYYTLLLEHYPSGMINYDLRERDRRIETEVGHARWTASNCSNRIVAITDDHALTLECELPDHGRTAAQCTSLLRELTYVADHCVHHLAMVRIVVQQELPQVVFPDSLRGGGRHTQSSQPVSTAPIRSGVPFTVICVTAERTPHPLGPTGA